METGEQNGRSISCEAGARPRHHPNGDERLRGPLLCGSSPRGSCPDSGNMHRSSPSCWSPRSSSSSGEVVPKTFVRPRADRLVSVTGPIVRLGEIFLYPLVAAVSWGARTLSAPFGGIPPMRALVTREELALLLQASRGGGSDVEPHERVMVRRAFRFGEKRVEARSAPSRRWRRFPRTPPAGTPRCCPTGAVFALPRVQGPCRPGGRKPPCPRRRRAVSPAPRRLPRYPEAPVRPGADGRSTSCCACSGRRWDLVRRGRDGASAACRIVPRRTWSRRWWGDRGRHPTAAWNTIPRFPRRSFSSRGGGGRAVRGGDRRPPAGRGLRDRRRVPDRSRGPDPGGGGDVRGPGGVLAVTSASERAVLEVRVLRVTAGEHGGPGGDEKRER